MTPPRYVFVGGLHRSGTSLVARLIASLPGVASIRGSGMPEDEGVYLQGAIPHTARHGAPMHFATDPAQHLIEGGRFDRLEVKRRLEADWDPWFAPAPWRVEKSPVNLTRTRLYQQLFPRSQFVIVTRHPQVVAAAMAKWTDRPQEVLVAHWLEAHRIAFADLGWLHAALVLRYEDVVAAPGRTRAELAAFLDLPDLSGRLPSVPGPSDLEPMEPIRDGNRDYTAFCPLPPDLAAALDAYGYGPDGRVDLRPLDIRHPLRSVRERVLALRRGDCQDDGSTS